MRVGIPREVKDGESRVALSPEGVKRLFLRVDAALASGVQVHAGRITHEFLARDTGRTWSPA